MEALLSTKIVAHATGLTERRIQQLAPKLVECNMAFKPGKNYVFLKSAIEWIRTLPETRGRKQNLKNNLNKA